jgi:phage terminase small subunit
MRTPLTPQQARFCESYIETDCAHKAYRKHYKTDRMAPESIYRKANALLNRPNVASQINELRKTNQKPSKVTVALLTHQLMEARELAMETRSPGAAVAAIRTISRLHGLDKPNQSRQQPAVIRVVTGISRGIGDPL